MIFIGAGIVLYLLMRSSVIAEFDASMLAKAGALGASMEQEPAGIEVELEPGQMPEFENRERPEYFQVWAMDGATLAKSPLLSEHSLVRAGSGQPPSARFLELPDGRAGRLLTVRLPIRRETVDGDPVDAKRDPVDAKREPAESKRDFSERPVPASFDSSVLLSVARDTRDMERVLSRIRWLLASVLLAASLVSAAAILVVVRHGLKPVNALAEQISLIDDNRLSKRIDAPDTAEELAPVVNRLNELLGRLQATLDREKGFTADVAHELRTPIAGLGTALEVCASRPRENAVYRETLSKCLVTVNSMRQMVNHLLLLARADAGQLTPEAESIDVSVFVASCWQPFEKRASELGLQVQWETPSEAVHLTTDGEKLRLVLNNLMDNAVRHVNPGGKIVIGWQRSPDDVTLWIENTGCTLAPAEVEHAFDRFWRQDDARADGVEHCGLGLSLCRTILQVLGGTISASAERQGVFAVSVLLPDRH
jgi:heavy metal sensor kinase